MKIFLTGTPHCGKSTLISKIVDKTRDKIGFITHEIPDNAGGRFGFELSDMSDNKAILAHVESKSPIRVSKYGVNIREFDSFIKPLFDIAPRKLLYIDEIGQMELYSDDFIKLVRLYLDSDNNFIGTLSSIFDHELIEEIKSNPNHVIYEITVNNRDQLISELSKKLEL